MREDKQPSRAHARIRGMEPWERVLRAYSPSAIRGYLWILARAGEDGIARFTREEYFTGLGYQKTYREVLTDHLGELTTGHPDGDTQIPPLLELIEYNKGARTAVVRVIAERE